VKHSSERWSSASPLAAGQAESSLPARARHTSLGARIALSLSVARPIWKGSISFGLVSIPVDLFPADATKDLAFHLLDKRDFAPVGYERINKETGKKVQWTDVVRGFEHKKGEYVVLTDAELASANVEATQMIDLVSFVEADEVDPMLFDKPYWLVPSAKSKGAARAYTLLREALAKTNKVGIGNVVDSDPRPPRGPRSEGQGPGAGDASLCRRAAPRIGSRLARW
jgi:hypothetical protein